MLTRCPHCQAELPKPRMGRPPKKPNERGEWLCTCCETYLPASEFGVDNNAINRLTSWCMRCRQRRGG
jgi:hypothetical protein